MIQISNVESQKTPLWLGKVTNQELIGRIKSGLFNFINGHIYFNNRVIKCRYDLLEKKGLKELEEDQVFDYFENILLLNEGELVKQGMPLSSQMQQRLVYLTSDYKLLYPNKVIILPYLHERKVFLSQTDKNYEYFYSSITMPIPRNPKHTLTFFISMNISQEEVKVYAESGILKRTINYTQIGKQCGKPITVSENGQIFLFRLPKTMVVSCVGLFIDVESGEINMKVLKKVNLEHEILKYAEEQSQENVGLLYLPKTEILEK